MATYTKTQVITAIVQQHGITPLDATRLVDNLSANGGGPYTQAQILALLHRHSVATPQQLARTFP